MEPVSETDFSSALALAVCRAPGPSHGHQGVRFIEQGHEVSPQEKKKRAQMLARALRKLGYEITITPINQLVPKPVG